MTSIATDEDALEHESKGSILVVDDQVDIAMTTTLLLHTLGYKADYTTSPQQALELMKPNHHYDLLITDVVMPGELNGVSLAMKVRESNATVKILLATAFAAHFFDKFYEDFAVIFKPFDRSQLAATVKRVLASAPPSQLYDLA